MSKRTCFLLAVLLSAAAAAAAERPSDRDVKALVDRVDKGRDTFEGALDDDLKHTVIRSPTGEVDVRRVLDDFQQSVERLKERLKPEYAASTEAGAVLRTATGIDRFLKQQPSSIKGASEWNRLAADLKSLAGAYGADFPLAENATVRRISDREVVQAAEALAGAGDRLRKALENDLKKDASVTPQARQAAMADAAAWSKDAKALRDRVKDGKPSSAEAARVQGGAARLKAFCDGKSLPTASGVWSSTDAPRQVITQAFGGA